MLAVKRTLAKQRSQHYIPTY